MSPHRVKDILKSFFVSEIKYRKLRRREKKKKVDADQFHRLLLVLFLVSSSSKCVWVQLWGDESKGFELKWSFFQN